MIVVAAAAFVSALDTTFMNVSMSQVVADLNTDVATIQKIFITGFSYDVTPYGSDPENDPFADYFAALADPAKTRMVTLSKSDLQGNYAASGTSAPYCVSSSSQTPSVRSDSSGRPAISSSAVGNMSAAEYPRFQRISSVG